MADEKPRGKNDKLLQEIRDKYHRWKNAWEEHRAERAIDMRYVAGDPWEDEDRRQREAAGRPCISLDEINQYLNQYCNNLRQNPKGIKIEPKGNGATNKTAEFQEDLIRGIEYESSAWRNAYLPAAEACAQGSYAFFRITREYKSDSSFEQVIRIEGILNPDSVTYDPNCKKADWSDAEGVFIAEPISKDEFRLQYANATIQDFTAEYMELAPDWIRDDHIVQAEYWKATIRKRLLLLIDSPEGLVTVFADELPDEQREAAERRAKKKRDVYARSLTKYITNGVEILEETPQPGTIIPIIPVIGKELWVPEGNTSKRKLMSMVRLMRDPQMLYAYQCSQEAEEASRTPLTPFVGAVGQFESDKDAWDTAHKVPHPYLQYNVVVDTQAGDKPLPAPERPQFTPNFQQYEIAKESTRRSIQAAAGIVPLPTAAQKDREKSGVAIREINSNEQIGSFHFTDNLSRALELAGKVIIEWIPVVYDTEREVGLRGANETHRVVKINTDMPVEDEKGQQYHYKTDEGDHAATISTGPSYQSQRAAVEDFVDTFMANLEAAAPDPISRAKVMALLVKLKQLGPLGDEIAEIFNPTEGSPQELQAKMAQMQQAAANSQQVIADLQAELQKLKLQQAGKVIDNEYKARAQKLDNDIEILKALITAKNQQEAQEYEMYKTFWLENHGAAHETALQKDQQAHESSMADKAHQQALEQGAQAGVIASAQSAQDAAQTAAQPQVSQ